MRLDELSRLLRATDPAAVLVAPVVLDRVLAQVNDVHWTIWRMPHNHCCVVDRSVLFQFVEQEEIQTPSDHLLPDRVLLLQRPEADVLSKPRQELLGIYWRLLYHVVLHRELEKNLASVGQTGLRDRIDTIGASAFEEARAVLIQDQLLPNGTDDRTTYIEFVATYLELRHFANNQIPVSFPSLPPTQELDALLARDVDGKKWFEATRLPATPDPVVKVDDNTDESHDFYYRLTRSADRVAASGDAVLAAITYTRAARVAPAALMRPASASARKAVYTLIERLENVLGLSEDQVSAWRGVLPELLDKADQGARPVEAALLYDLQRACVDREKPLYTLDLFEWIMSAGNRPMRRVLDGQRYVRVPNHFRLAARRLTAARLNEEARQQLGQLLRDAIDQSESQLRQRFRPVLTNALHDAGMKPTSLPEEAAVAKTVEELLDRISATGHLSFPDVRDAIARGQMKLNDLSGPHEYLLGDPLLRLDRRLATLLDGIYRRGEFYVRWLERVTSFSFGTRSGRWLTRNVTLPFGGALLIAQFVWLLVYERREVIVDTVDDDTAAAAMGVAVNATPPPFLGGWNQELWFHAAWVVVGIFFLLMIQSERIRNAVTHVGMSLWRTVRFIIWDVPLRVVFHPTMREFLASGPFQILINYAVKPMVLAVVLWAAFPYSYESWTARIITVLGSAALVNSRLGRAVEALLFQTAHSFINLIRSAPALIRWISDIFQNMIDVLEWTLARGEDWFRLRDGSGPISIALRAIMSLIWFPIAFLIRFYLVVLIEPMLNPLKLPLSILFAKFVYPLLAVLGLFNLQQLNSPLVAELAPFISKPVAWVIVIGTFYLLPDAVTFLFWEMRENWRLYRANRPDRLKAVHVGPHGETVAGLLQMSFHSGTIPRLYRKLRLSVREAVKSDSWRDARTHRESLKSVRESVRRFVIRDLTAVLNSTPGWGGRQINATDVSLGTNRITIELAIAGESNSAYLVWENRSDWLVAHWEQLGWLKSLTPHTAKLMTHALAYLYKRAGIHLVQEHLQESLPKEMVHFDIVTSGLLVWYGSRDSTPVLYDLLRRPDDLRPRSPDNVYFVKGPTLNADKLMFSRVNLTWPAWVEVWQADRNGEQSTRFGPKEFDLALLPMDWKDKSGHL